MMFVKTVIAFLLFAGDVSFAVEPPTEPNTEPVEYSHEGDALLGHLSIPAGEGGPYPGMF